MVTPTQAVQKTESNLLQLRFFAPLCDRFNCVCVRAFSRDFMVGEHHKVKQGPMDGGPEEIIKALRSPIRKKSTTTSSLPLLAPP